MKLLSPHRRPMRQRAWALLAVMTLAGVGLMLLASVMDWADENSSVTERNNEYFTTSYAAEAATEKALAKLSQDFQNYGFSTVSTNIANGTYAARVPASSDDALSGAYWNAYQFSGGHTMGQVIVTNTGVSNSVVLAAPYAGLSMTANTYEIIANAQNTQSQYKIVSTVGQQVNCGYIPLFQFAIFYQDDMELAPNEVMNVTGTVHGNGNIYIEPQNALNFSNAVSAAGKIIMGEDPNDNTHPTNAFGLANFGSFELSGVDPLNLPVGTNTTGLVTNVSDNVYGILKPPAAGQTPDDPSGVGENLLYNKADMIIVISNDNTITVTSGAGVNGQATTVTNWQAFMSTNGSFYDQRDNLTVNPITIDVSNLVNWSATNNSLRPALAAARDSSQADVQSIYVADLRSTTNVVVTTSYTMVTNFFTNTATPTTTRTLPPNLQPSGQPAAQVISLTYNYNILGNITGIASYTYYPISAVVVSNGTSVTNLMVNTQPGIVLSNGSVLPPQGLSVATPDPAYIVGDWNVKNSSAPGAPSDSGTADTTYTRPSGIYADAITVLSSAWNPANSTLSLNNRIAANDTVNAAFLTGNVPSADGSYSGGVENFVRFLENWNSQTFTYNGSLVQMFKSQIATAPYPGMGSVYNAPTRNWAFDNNFTDPNKQPPLMPKVTSVVRSAWVLLPPYTTRF